MLQDYLKYVGKHADKRELVAQNWQAIKDNLEQSTNPWKKAAGPIASMVLTLRGTGWTPHEAFRWQDGEDDLIDDENAPIAEVVAEYKSKNESNQWTRASTHYLGKGLQQGADFTVPRSRCKEYGQQGSYREQQIMNNIIVGASWNQERAYKAGLTLLARLFAQDATSR